MAEKGKLVRSIELSAAGVIGFYVFKSLFADSKEARRARRLQSEIFCGSQPNPIPEVIEIIFEPAPNFREVPPRQIAGLHVAIFNQALGSDA
ncbi:TPA: hypothetical protein DIS56_03345 [Candidatus Saccharibacteria bacterium]|nr:MAG: hypothetical protein UX30_C0003G0051 [Candidatus Saccharibacteria bacterium GW2011_GWA2_46_10]OGL36042.1 MAG: hypothetical protein A3F05_00985 [Candidatus Saccharibacteria bacterium RIFCSPHIGHO2_12_FULL_47_17]HCM52137.1 hypothetical protein [Candidatus Saccharibacteria bacterium]